MAVVTGANRGIGLEVTRQLATLDYTVVLGTRDLARGEAAARELTAGDRVMVRRLDVTDESTIDRVRDEIAESFGSLHVLVNNGHQLRHMGKRCRRGLGGRARHA